MHGRGRGLVLLTVLILSVAVWVIPARAGTYVERSFIDHWRGWDYFGNEGTHDFNGPWQESGDDGKSNSGYIFAAQSNSCPTDNRCLAIGSEDAVSSGLSIQRYADTGGATKVKLGFDYLELFEDADEYGLHVQVKGAGRSWTTVDTISLGAASGGVDHWEKDITQYAAESMGIRIQTANGSAEGFVLIDAVEIWATIDVTTTTTTTTTAASTSTTTTTTEVPGTTATTEPPTTTTTTQPSATTTTTTQPTGTTTTTTTQPTGTTTTTVASTPGTTTTTTPGTAAVAPVPPDQGGGTTEAEKVPLTPEEVADYSSKAGMSLDDAMPMLMVPSGSESDAATEAPNGSEAGTTRTPTEGLMATFSTSAETLQANSVSVVLLGVLIAWLAVRGLGRSRWGRRNAADVPGHHS
jgi:hypothetical protein